MRYRRDEAMKGMERPGSGGEDPGKYVPGRRRTINSELCLLCVTNSDEVMLAPVMIGTYRHRSDLPPVLSQESSDCGYVQPRKFTAIGLHHLTLIKK